MFQLKSVKTILTSLALSLVLSLFSFSALIPATVHAESDKDQKKSQSHKKDKISYKTVTKTETINFSKQTKKDETLPKGQTKISQKGVNGKKKITYKVTYTNGKATKWQAQSTKVLTKAVPQITLIGTYVAQAPAPAPEPAQVQNYQPSCTNGSYVNSAGNTVCSPETTSSVPAGATAQCVDGSYSFSQSHSGTCSHHGGVSMWL
jgi:hypothetical protein